MNPTIKLTCPQCRYENEPERIYCHSCGARLDRSALAKAMEKAEDPKKASRQHLKAMFDPRRAKLRSQAFLLGKLILGALVVALVVQTLRPPDLPPPPAKTTALAPQINLDLENLGMDSTLPSLSYTAAQINAYLAYVLKPKNAALGGYLHLDRVLASFEEGACRVTAVRSLLGLNPTTTAVGSVQIENNAVVATPNGIWIGRMPVHPLFIPYLNSLFADVRLDFQREQRMLAKLGSIEFHPDTVVITARQR